MRLLRLTALGCTGLATAMALSACDGPSPTAKGDGPYHAEAFCNVKNFPASLRQTVVIIDGREFVHADQPEDIRARNGNVIDAVADIVAKSLAPRERIKIMLAPVDGMQPKLLFTGCLPGYSAEELKTLASQGADGAVKTFIGQSDTQKVAEALDTFRTTAVGSLVQAARAVPDQQKGDDGVPFVASSIIQSLRKGAGVIDLEDGIPRVFLLSNLAQFDIGSPSDPSEARKAGFAAATGAGVNLSRAELHVMLAKAGSPFAQEFASAFFLGSEAWLADWGKDLPSTLSNPPVNVMNYTGTVDYVHASYPMQARLAVDRNGTLVNSWVLLKHDTEWATPLTGAFNCNEAQVCVLTSDNGVFAQVWAKSFGFGGKPDFNPNLPFAGLRSIELTTANGKAKGRISDPSVSQIGDKPALGFELSGCEHCRI